MAETIQNSNKEEQVNFKQQCLKCLKNWNPIKIIVVLMCVAMVVQQITSCIKKLIDVPITTYTHFDYNKTITYPSITFCREPAYKQDIMTEYGLYSHPIMTSTWRNFNFSRIPIDKLWNEITYTDQDMFVQYALDSLRENVIVTSTMTLIHGRCYTLSPKDLNRKAKATRESGYSIMVQHAASDLENPTSLNPPGYHVFVHYVKEPFTEVDVFNGGLVDQLYINTGETVNAKLKVNEYVMISNEDDPCTYQENYSANACTTQYVSELVAAAANCSGPWMTSDRPYCDNFEDMRNLISSYYTTYDDHHCNRCPRFCHSYLYNMFVTDRQKYYYWDPKYILNNGISTDGSLQTQIYFYFNSMMVSVYKEKYNYDWNMFISDLGGSVSRNEFLAVIGRYLDVIVSKPITAKNSELRLHENYHVSYYQNSYYGFLIQGFLLGLSVISLINIMGKIWVLLQPFICEKKNDILTFNSFIKEGE